jgi:hypothetical protein
MAATLTEQKVISIGQSEALVFGTISFTGDTSYPTGGEAIDAPGDKGYHHLLVTSSGGYIGQWDATNQKIKAYYGDNNNASDGPLIEVPDTTDLNAVSFPFIGLRPA